MLGEVLVLYSHRAFPRKDGLVKFEMDILVGTQFDEDGKSEGVW